MRISVRGFGHPERDPRSNRRHLREEAEDRPDEHDTVIPDGDFRAGRMQLPKLQSHCLGRNREVRWKLHAPPAHARTQFSKYQALQSRDHNAVTNLSLPPTPSASSGIHEQMT